MKTNQMNKMENAHVYVVCASLISSFFRGDDLFGVFCSFSLTSASQALPPFYYDLNESLLHLL